MTIESVPRALPTTGILASLSLAMLLASLGTSIANVGLPALAQAFDASFQQVQWVVLAYLLAVTTLIVSVGRLGDVLGRRRLMLAGVAAFTVASLACGAAPVFWLLVVARAVQGFGAAILMALAIAIVGDALPKDRTGAAMGLLGTMSAVGTALGPSLGGVLIAAFGWRALFFAGVPVGAVAFMLAYRYLPVDPATTRARFDIPGTALLALTLLAYALAMTLGRGAFGVRNALLLLGACAGAGLFVFVETKVATPLVRLSMMRDRVLVAGFATSALVTTVVMATLVVGPFYLAGALAQDAAHVGFAMSAGSIVAAVAGVPAGRCVDRFGAARVAIAGLVGMGVGTVCLAMAQVRFGVVGYIAPIVVLTAGYALFQAANNTAVMRALPAEQRGVVSGLLNLSRNLGLITGASLMGAVFAAGSTGVAVVHGGAVAAGLRATFLVATALIFVALVLAGRARVARAATRTLTHASCGEAHRAAAPGERAPSSPRRHSSNLRSRL